MLNDKQSQLSAARLAALAQPQLLFNPVAGDDIINIAESQELYTPLSGRSVGAAEGDLVRIKLNGKTYSALVGPDGSWSMPAVKTADLLAANGKFTATLFVTDDAGDLTPYSFSHVFNVDLERPAKPDAVAHNDEGQQLVDIPNGGTTEDTTPTFTGGGQKPGDTVVIREGDKVIGSASVDAGGNWGIAVKDPLATGEHHFTIQSADAAGNQSEPTDYAITVGQSGPSATVTILAMDKESGVDVHDWLTNNGAAGRLISGTVHGTLAAGEKVQVSTDGGKSWTDAYVDGNHWDVMDPNAHSGDFTIQARVVDGHDVSSAIASQAVALDSVLPSHATGLSYADNIATVSFSGADKQVGDLIDVIVAGKHFSHALTAAEITAGSAKVEVSGAKSIYDLQAAMVDRAGNVSDYLSVKPGAIKQNFDSASLDIVDAYDETLSKPGLAVGQSHDLGNLTITYKKSLDSTFTGGTGIAVGYNGWGNTSKVLQISGVVNVDLKGAIASSLTADLYDIQSGLTGQAIRFYNGDLLLATWDLHPYAIGEVAGQANGTQTYKLPAGLMFTRFEIDGGNDIIALDNLVLGTNTPDTLAYTPAATEQTTLAGSTDYYGDDANNVFNVADVTTLATAGVHGNGGLDTLKLTGERQTLNVSELIDAGKLDGVEVLDITGSGNNTVNLKLGDVMHLGEKNTFLADDHVQLMVKGDIGDVVNLSDVLPDGVDPGNWVLADTQTIDGVEYNRFQFVTTTGTVFNAAEVLVQQGVTVNTGATLTITHVAGDDIVDFTEARGTNSITGTSTGARAGDVVTLTINGKDYTGAVAADGSWTVTGIAGSDLVADSDHIVDGKLHATDADGKFTDAITSHGYKVLSNVVSITSMSKDSGIDPSHAGDFITADGSAGRGVYGTVLEGLTGNQKVQVSFNGTTWVDADTHGLNWVAVDTGAHNADWSIQARIVDGSVVQSDVASKDVTYLGTLGAAPKITSIPDAVGNYSSAKAADGSDVVVSLSGTIAKAGDLVHIIWGSTTYDQKITAADIAAGVVTAKVPAQDTNTQGATYDFNVSAQIVTEEGQISPPSAAYSVVGQGWSTSRYDGLQGYPYGNIYSGTGFNITGSTSFSHSNGTATNAPGLLMYSSNTYNYFQINFTEGASNLSLTISGLEASSRVVVYDKSGYMLSSTYVYPSGNNGYFSYTAPSGYEVGKVMVYCDGVDSNGQATVYAGTSICNLSFTGIQHGPSTSTGQTLIDHTWETYFDDNGNTSHTVSMSIDPTAYFAQGTAHVHGGAAIDTLKLTGANQVLDLRALTGDNGEAKISSIEKFDITGTGNNTLKISLNDVLHLGGTDLFQKDGKVQVLVDGDAGDKVELYGLHDHGTTSDTWHSAGSTTIGGATYQVYAYDHVDAEVLIKQAVAASVA